MIDFTAAITDFDGNPIDGGSPEKPMPLTLASVSVLALNALSREDENLAGDEKFKRGMLAYHIHKGETDKLSVDDISLIKKLVGKLYNPMVVVRAYQLLDPAATGAA
jgi:hypothetical protein